MALQQAVRTTRITGAQIPPGIAALVPYALISMYYLLLFAARGLRGGDLDQCTSVPADQIGDAGACPYFAGPLHHNPWDAAVLRYHVWSSRFTVELVEYGLSHTLWLFVIMTFAMAWLFIWSARDLLQIRTTLGLTTFAGLYCLLIPIQFQWNAGVYSTVIFCAWTAYLGLFAVTVIVRLIRRQSVGLVTIVATVAALAFALCSEQFIAAFTFVIGALAYQVLFRRRRDLRAPLALYATLWAGAVANVLLSPGNSIRQAREIDYWMPQFATMSTVDKLSTGLHHALWILVRPDVATVTLVVILALILFASARTGEARTSYLPAVAITAWLVLLVTIYAFGGDLSRHTTTTILAGVLLAVPLTWGAADITRGDQSTRVMILLVLGAGFGSAMLLSFSPTVWASDTRTLLLQYFAIVATVFLLARSTRRRPTRSAHSAIAAATRSPNVR